MVVKVSTTSLPSFVLMFSFFHSSIMVQPNIQLSSIILDASKLMTLIIRMLRYIMLCLICSRGCICVYHECKCFEQSTFNCFVTCSFSMFFDSYLHQTVSKLIDDYWVVVWYDVTLCSFCLLHRRVHQWWCKYLEQSQMNLIVFCSFSIIYFIGIYSTTQQCEYWLLVHYYAMLRLCSTI